MPLALAIDTNALAQPSVALLLVPSALVVGEEPWPLLGVNDKSPLVAKVGSLPLLGTHAPLLVLESYSNSPVKVIISVLNLTEDDEAKA